MIWSGFFAADVGDLKWIFWCGVWVIWNGFSVAECVGDLERSDLKRIFWCGVWVIWNNFLQRSVGDLERFI